MNDVMKGKTLFVVNLINANGSYIGHNVLRVLQEGDYSGVAVKFCHGAYWNGGHSKADRDKFIAEVKGLVRVYGWHWNEGNDPVGEAAIASQAINELGLEAWMMDYEAPMKANPAAQTIILAEFRKRQPTHPLGLCSYRYPSFHPQILWNKILPYFDFHAPQVYWVENHNPADQLQKSYDELMALKPMPFFPVGSAYSDNPAVWVPTAEDLREFDQKAFDMGLTGVQWFTYRSMQDLGLIPIIRDLAWPIYPPDAVVPPPPVQDCTAEIGQALERQAEIYAANLKLIEKAAYNQGIDDALAATWLLRKP